MDPETSSITVISLPHQHTFDVEKSMIPLEMKLEPGLRTNLDVETPLATDLLFSASQDPSSIDLLSGMNERHEFPSSSSLGIADDNLLSGSSTLFSTQSNLAVKLEATEISPSPTKSTTAPPPSSSKKSKKSANPDPNHTPRPPNSFILYRREKHSEIVAQHQSQGAKAMNNNMISKIVADMWRQESPEVKAIYAAKAEEEKQAHLLKYPGYKYRPRKSAKRVSNDMSGESSNISSSRAPATKKASSSKRSQKQKQHPSSHHSRSSPSVVNSGPSGIMTHSSSPLPNMLPSVVPGLTSPNHHNEAAALATLNAALNSTLPPFDFPDDPRYNLPLDFQYDWAMSSGDYNTLQSDYFFSETSGSQDNSCMFPSSQSSQQHPSQQQQQQLNGAMHPFTGYSEFGFP
jgi:hypothetical protein